jgi:hypothetical protein
MSLRGALLPFATKQSPVTEGCFSKTRNDIKIGENLCSALRHKHYRNARWRLIPLGVNSNFRFWGEGITPYVEKAKGSVFVGCGWKKYIDYRMAFGPIILGHSLTKLIKK